MRARGACIWRNWGWCRCRRRANCHGTAERRALYARVWQQESRDLPIIYLYTQRNIQGVANSVGGFTLLADGLLRLQDVQPAQ